MTTQKKKQKSLCIKLTDATTDLFFRKIISSLKPDDLLCSVLLRGQTSQITSTKLDPQSNYVSK